ncbi:tetratricopeptide repeat protein [Mesohalobacter halotolerans]|uniref:Uncharacterized protein n=1 Tax=Mesohalobacter halotolerans TaxID=1883405 RepID=A0A4U5TVB8_9FLAO|nr:hypothetical protein [Mesohalobacter halotolerans]MBS3738812.1 hypothetical protein [Psychroflexus sp.]TKS57534.1 hypothetical protein FCN74_03720 [Mesohalobacter halotolerans]
MKKICLAILLLSFHGHHAQTLDDYVQLGQYAKAIEGYSKLENPSTTDKLVLAKAYCAKGMYADCKETYQNALKSTKADAFLTSRFQYAKLLKTQKQYKTADSIYTNLLDIMPNHPEILYQKGKIADALKQMAYHQFYLDALSYDPKHIKAAHEATRYFMAVDNLKLAKKISQKTLELVPNTPKLINLRAQIFYREDNWQMAIKYIDKLETLKSDLPKFIYDIKGNSYLKLNEPKKALIAFQNAFIKDNQDLQLCLKLSEIHLYLKEPKKAIPYLLIYEKLRDTSMWRFNFLMGKYHMQNQDYKIAFYQFQKSYDENWHHEDSQYYRALAADYAFEDKSKVLDYYMNYIETYEDEKDAKYLNAALRRETEIRRELFMKK